MLTTLLITFLLAALSGMGVGGGGIFVIYLSLFTDTPQLTAQGMNLLFFLCSSGASMLIHLRRRTLCGVLILLMASFGILGALLGTALSAYLPQALLRKIFGGMLIVSGILALRQKKQSSDGEAPSSTP